MLGNILKPDLEELIKEGRAVEVKEVVKDWHESDIAELVSDLEPNWQAFIFRLLPQELQVDVFEYLDLESQKSLLNSLAKEDLAIILNEMSPDDRTALLEELPGPIVNQLLRLLSPQEREIATKLIGYPPDSIGRLMTTEFVALKKEWSIQQTIEYLRSRKDEIENINYLYVVDNKGRLYDELTIKEIIFAPPEKSLSEITDGSCVYLNAFDDKEFAVNIFKKYDTDVLPVVDNNHFLVGVVTVDDVMDVAEEESTEDIQKFGGLEALDYPYRETSLWQLIKKRAGWLSFLFLSEMLTATAMAHFEHLIAQAVVLAIFVPLIISSGGNSGSQAATLIVRSLALREVTLKDWLYVMKRELFSGLILGTVLGTLGFLRITVWSLFSDVYGANWLLIALTIFLSLILVVMWGTSVGAMLPFVMKKLGFDPASSSAPFVATLVDVIGIVIYFSVASMILRNMIASAG